MEDNSLKRGEGHAEEFSHCTSVEGFPRGYVQPSKPKTVERTHWNGGSQESHQEAGYCSSLHTWCESVGGERWVGGDGIMGRWEGLKIL